MCNSRCDSGACGSASIARRTGWLFVPILVLLLLAGCVPFGLRGILDGPTGKALSLSPQTIVVPACGTVTFVAEGGVPPYVYSIVSGGGTLDSATGLYTAPLAIGSAEMQVTDATNKAAKASATILPFPNPLTVTPAALSLQRGSNVDFTAIGGTPPYTFAWQSNVSGSPTLPASTVFWHYVAGMTPGIDKIVVTDGASVTFVVTVNVTPLTSSVDYTIPSTNFPAAGTVSSAIPGGYTFTLKNSGSAQGTQSVDWKVFLSSNAVIDGGDMMVASGTVPTPLAANASVPVSITGSFPLVSPGVWNLIAEVSAADDTSPANNRSAAGSLTLAPLDINYSAPVFSSPVVGIIAGTAVSGTLDITNVGGADGSADVEWTLYASSDGVIDITDHLVARGGISGGLASGATGATAFSGYWPSTPGPWYLITQVSAGDDNVPGNNTGAPVLFTTTGPPPANVDYNVLSVTRNPGQTAGDPLSGTFTVRNDGSDPGAQAVLWTAYLSSNGTLELGTDPVIDAGSFAGLGPGVPTGPITFAGTWPSLPGNWQLIVAVSAADELAPGGNDQKASAAVLTLPPAVDYTVESVQSTGGTKAGSALDGSFVIRNVGSHAGSQFVPWTVYLSPDATLDVGSDQLLATNSLAAPGLGPGAPSGPIFFTGTWPGANTAKTWYLFAVVAAGDDVNAGNNSGSSAGVLVNPPNIDYRITSVTNTGGTTGGGPVGANFVLNNNGTVGGAASVAWTAYVSSNATLEITDQVIATGSWGPLAGGASTGIGFGGTWPAGTGTWYLIVKADTSDDVNPANNLQVTGPIAVTAAAPVYSIAVVPIPVGSQTGLPVSGAFSVQNTSASGGVAPVNWQVYASKNNAVYNAGDVLLASGSAAGVAGLGSVSPPWAGTWPDSAGTYYIVVRISAADAPAVPDASSAAIVVTNPPPPDYTVSLSAATPWTGLVSTPMSNTGTCQITIQNLNANPGYASVTWSVYISTDNILGAGDVLVQQGSIGPLASLGSSTFAYAGSWPATGGIYYLIASAIATDDATSANNIVPAPHPSAVGDYRYKEGLEDNSDNGAPPPPLTAVSKTLVTTLGANQSLVIEGTMDAFNLFDTYEFATVLSMTVLKTSAFWLTGFDDIDLYLWDIAGSDIPSRSTGINSEPGASTLTVTGVTPRTCYISANFYLANNTSGSVGKPYVIIVTGKP